MELKKYGPWAFYVALVAALVLVFFQGQQWAVWLLAILGLVVGVLNISEKETTTFLLASIAWMAAGQFLSGIFSTIPLVGGYVASFLSNVVTFVGPAAAVVALVGLYRITKD